MASGLGVCCVLTKQQEERSANTNPSLSSLAAGVNTCCCSMDIQCPMPGHGGIVDEAAVDDNDTHEPTEQGVLQVKDRQAGRQLCRFNVCQLPNCLAGRQHKCEMWSMCLFVLLSCWFALDPGPSFVVHGGNRRGVGAATAVVGEEEEEVAAPSRSITHSPGGLNKRPAQAGDGYEGGRVSK